MNRLPDRSLLCATQLSVATGLGAYAALPHHQIGLEIGGALGVHADLIGLLPERLALDARSTALGHTAPSPSIGETLTPLGTG